MTSLATSGWRWTLVLSAICLVLMAAGFYSWDQPVLDAVREGVGKSFRGLARFLSRYGDFPWLLGGGLIGLLF